MSPTTDASLVDHRGRKYLTADERTRFLAAVRAQLRDPLAAPVTAE